MPSIEDSNLAPCTWHTPESEICILVVDDQPENLLSIKTAIKDSDYVLVTASSGAEAVEKAQKYEFAAILLDIQMPHLNGYEIAKLIRQSENSRVIPIIFITAFFNEEKHIQEASKIGAVDYLFKPINVDILRAKLELFAELFRKTKEIQYHTQIQHRRETDERDRQILKIKESTEQKYQDLVEGITNGIVWLADPNSLNFTFVSPHAENILGYKISDWYSDQNFLFSHISAEDHHAFRLALQNAKESGDDVEIEHRIVRSDGCILWFKTNIRLRESSKGNEFRGLSVDVTNLKETEKSLRESIHARDEFLSVASHELKTPLTPLQLQVEAFERLFSQNKLVTAPRDKLSRMLKTSVTQVDILVRLIDQLLDISRVSSGVLQLVITKTDLVQCIHNVTSLFEDELKKQNIILEINTPISLVGCWDKVRIEQVLVNLIQNAMKYGKQKPIVITLKSTPHEKVLLVVSDFGIGIAERDRSRIFERYERAVPKSSFSGLGLGLYISKQLVELHGGRIWVESTPEECSSFFVELPLN